MTIEEDIKVYELKTVHEAHLHLAYEQAPCEGGKKFGARSVNPAAKRVGVGA